MLFLNNAINHGVFTPLGIEQATETGKSILFLIEAENPGPGVGLLLAFTFFGVGAAKASAPGAAIIQFFGGIHEIYFPYALEQADHHPRPHRGWRGGRDDEHAPRRRPRVPRGSGKHHRRDRRSHRTGHLEPRGRLPLGGHRRRS